MAPTFSQRLDGLLRARKTFLTVGLDPRPHAFPLPLQDREPAEALPAFLEGIVQATRPHCVLYKAQFASYLAFGEAGLRTLFALPRMVGKDHLTMLDIKVGDIPSTMELYREGIFDRLGFDAMTVNPFLGWDSVQALLGPEGRGAFVLLHTSNPGAADIQESKGPSGTELWRTLLPKVRELGVTGNVGGVVGGTFPEAISQAREGLGPDVPLLVPGVGAQGASLEEVVARGQGGSGGALLVNSSRGILYASRGEDWREAAGAEAERLTREMRACSRPSPDRAPRADRPPR